MRVLVTSDSHGDAYRLEQAILAQPSATAVIHLGDGAREAENAAEKFPQLTFYQVRGNCDLGAFDLPLVRRETLGGRRLFLTHGHVYEVKYGLYRAVCAAREQEAHVLLFGHTHEPLSTYDDGLYIVNPGSLHSGRYAFLDISPAGIMPSLCRL